MRRLHAGTIEASPKRSPVRRRRKHECERASGRNAALLSGPQPVAQGRPRLVSDGALLAAAAADCSVTTVAVAPARRPRCSASGDRIDGEHSIGIVADLTPAASARLPRRTVVMSLALTVDEPQLLVASRRLGALEGDGAVEDLGLEKRLHQLVVGAVT